MIKRGATARGNFLAPGSISGATPSKQLQFNSQQNNQRVEITTVQQITDRTFFKRNNRWVDSIALKNESAKPDRVVEFGTPEFYKLADQLLREGPFQVLR